MWAHEQLILTPVLTRESFMSRWALSLFFYTVPVSAHFPIWARYTVCGRPSQNDPEWTSFIFYWWIKRIDCFPDNAIWCGNEQTQPSIQWESQTIKKSVLSLISSINGWLTLINEWKIFIISIVIVPHMKRKYARCTLLLYCMMEICPFPHFNPSHTLQ